MSTLISPEGASSGCHMYWPGLRSPASASEPCARASMVSARKEMMRRSNVHVAMKRIGYSRHTHALGTTSHQTPLRAVRSHPIPRVPDLSLLSLFHPSTLRCLFRRRLYDSALQRF